MTKTPRSYNVAALFIDGSTISTQLWDATPEDVVREIDSWARNSMYAGRIIPDCPVVVSQHVAEPNSKTYTFTTFERAHELALPTCAAYLLRR